MFLSLSRVSATVTWCAKGGVLTTEEKKPSNLDDRVGYGGDIEDPAPRYVL